MMGLLSRPRLTDAEVVERARRWLRWRRRVGVLLLILGLALTVGGGYAVYAVIAFFIDPGEAWVEFINDGGEGESGAARRTDPLTAEQVKTWVKASFDLGMTLATVLLVGGPFLISGFVWIVTRDREREMLVALWDDAEPGPHEQAAPPG